MQDKTIDNALLALRKQTIREGREGLPQIEALLLMRGVAMPRIMRAKRENVARRGHMRLMVMAALRDRPMTMREVAAYVADRRPEMTPDVAYRRAGLCLARMKREGMVRREGRLWLAKASGLDGYLWRLADKCL